MKQEDKQLLLADLCARLPYGVILNVTFKNKYDKIDNRDIELTDGNLTYITSDSHWRTYKPYLRPMSSMTEEEMEELKTLCSIYIPTDSPNIAFEDYGIIVFTHHLRNNTYSFKLNISVIDWLNRNHFDYRGLIEKGLAIAVNKNNNPYIN